MEGDKIKVVWLAPFPIGNLKGTISVKPGSIGTGTWIYNLAMELANYDDIELHILSESGNIPYTQKFTENKIDFHLIRNTVPFIKKGYPNYFPLNEATGYFINSFRICKELRKINPDIVHAHGTENSYAITSLRSKYRSVISMQGILSEIIKKNPKPIVRDKLKVILERKVVKSGLNFICRTNLDTSFIKTLNPNANLYLVHEAVNPVFSQKKWENRKENKILYVGSLQERKGVGVLLKSLVLVKEKIQNICLYLIGTGSNKYVNELLSFCNSNGLRENVIFMGFQKPEVIADYHTKSQMLVLPSFIENSPNCIAEALVSGLPVIAANVGGISSMVINGKTGILVRPGEVSELASSIVSLLSDSVLKQQLSEKAKQYAKSIYLPQTVARETIAVYRDIIERNHL